MRWRPRRVMVLVASLACLLGSTAAAQDKPADLMDVLREKVRTDKKLVVAVALELTESEAKAFWPVYGAYQSDMIVHYDRVAKLIGDYSAAYASMSDDVATQLLGEFVSIESEYAALLTKYLPRFQRVLPPRKVARFYQLENKLRGILSYQLARDIPMVK